jgi:hypothetical protein
MKEETVSVNDSHLTSTYVATIDADIETAREALRAIDPMSPLATRLSALGLDDRAVWVESSETGLTDPEGAPELGFSLLWRLGPPDQTARIAWQIRLSEDGVDRTVLSIAIHAQASDSKAGKRITAGWPIIETITREHAKRLRRALDDYAADPCGVDRLLELPALSAAV